MTDTPAPTISSPYLGLINEFALSRGMAADAVSLALGLEFETDDGLIARVRGHPQDGDRLMLEVDVQTLSDESMQTRSAAMLALHQLNHAARAEHDWLIVIDDESVLMMSVSLWVDRTDVGGLEAMLADGIARGQALRRLWNEMLDERSGDADADPSALPIPAPGMMLRG